MATYWHGYEEKLERAIRDAIAIDPVAGIHQLPETLSKRLDHSFDPRYIKRCVRQDDTSKSRPA